MPLARRLSILAVFGALLVSTTAQADEDDVLIIDDGETGEKAAAPIPPGMALFSGTFQSFVGVDTGFEGAQEDIVEWRNRLDVGLKMDVTPSLRVVASGRMRHWIGLEGAREAGDLRADTFRSVFEAELRDTYATWSFAWGLDLRVGMQTFTWGRTDFSQPLDVLNPLDLREGLVDQNATPKASIFAVEAATALGDVDVSLVWIPFFQGHRFDLFGSDWSLMNDDLPFLSSGTMSEYLGLLDVIHPTRYEELQAIFPATEDPPQDGFTGADAGLRLTTNLAGVDLGLACAYQWDRLPTLRNIDFAQLQVGITGMLSGNKAANAEAIRQAMDIGYDRRLVAGGDFEWTVGAFAFKGDVAFSDARTLYTEVEVPVGAGASELSIAAIRKPSLGWAFQVDSMPGGGLFLSLEASGTHVFDLEAGTKLLLLKKDLYRLSALAQWRFGGMDEFRLQVSGIWGISQNDGLLMPQFTWRVSGLWSAQAGASLFFGDPEEPSPIALFDKNDFAYLRAQLSF